MSVHGYHADMMSQSPMIDVQLLQRPVRSVDVTPFPDSCGAECIFLGRTRTDHNEIHGKLVKLSYEAYQHMAERVLRELADEAVQKFGCAAVRIHHAVGEVSIGEASVLVQVCCGHRDRAFTACRFLIDTLKQRVPIWKLEVWSDGTTWSRGQPVSEGESA